MMNDRVQQLVDENMKCLQDAGLVNGRGEVTLNAVVALLRVAKGTISPSDTPPAMGASGIHPNVLGFMESAVTEALSELDKLGQPHRIGCNLAGAWGLMKGYLGAQASKEDSLSTTEEGKS